MKDRRTFSKWRSWSCFIVEIQCQVSLRYRWTEMMPESKFPFAAGHGQCTKKTRKESYKFAATESVFFLCVEQKLKCKAGFGQMRQSACLMIPVLSQKTALSAIRLSPFPTRNSGLDYSCSRVSRHPDTTALQVPLFAAQCTETLKWLSFQCASQNYRVMWCPIWGSISHVSLSWQLSVLKMCLSQLNACGDRISIWFVILILCSGDKRLFEDIHLLLARISFDNLEAKRFSHSLRERETKRVKDVWYFVGVKGKLQSEQPRWSQKKMPRCVFLFTRASWQHTKIGEFKK